MLATLGIEAQQAQALEHGVLQVDATVAVVIVLAQFGEAVGGAVLVAEQFAAIVDATIAVAVQRQQGVVATGRADAVRTTVGVQVEAHGIVQAAGAEAIAGEVEHQRIGLLRLRIGGDVQLQLALLQHLLEAGGLGAGIDHRGGGRRRLAGLLDLGRGLFGRRHLALGHQRATQDLVVEGVAQAGIQLFVQRGGAGRGKGIEHDRTRCGRYRPRLAE